MQIIYPQLLLKISSGNKSKKSINVLQPWTKYLRQKYTMFITNNHALFYFWWKENLVNPFSTNVPLMNKPGSWFLQAKNTPVEELHFKWRCIKSDSSTGDFQTFC